jgi:hypothetical protein
MLRCVPEMMGREIVLQHLQRFGTRSLRQSKSAGQRARAQLRMKSDNHDSTKPEL